MNTNLPERTMHILAQGSYHEDAFIVANRQALINLRDAIDRALSDEGSGVASAFVADGEGYDTIVIRHDGDFDRICYPYTEDYARESRPEGEVMPLVTMNNVAGRPDGQTRVQGLISMERYTQLKRGEQTLGGVAKSLQDK